MFDCGRGRGLGVVMMVLFTSLVVSDVVSNSDVGET